MSNTTFTIKAAQSGDVPILAQLSADAFEEDRNTQMKSYGKEPFDLRKYWLENMPALLQNPNCVILKAVDDASGDVMGYCNWGFYGFQPDEMPIVDGRVQPPESAKVARHEQERHEESITTETQSIETDPIKRLEALTGADLRAWATETMSRGTRCLYINSLSVSPKYQRLGVGSALLRWGTNFCDERAVFAWVSSSEPAWPMYEKSGFQVVRSLDVDLDEYAPIPPPNEGPGAKWGHYIFRYMKYLPTDPRS